MPNATSDRRLHRRILVHPGVYGEQRATNKSGGGSPVRAAIPSPSPSPPPSRLQPLTPANTFSDEFESAGDLLTNSLLDLCKYSAVDSEDGLLEYIEPPSEHDGDKEKEAETDDEASLARHDSKSGSTVSMTSDADRMSRSDKPWALARSSSAPSHPLKSALAASPLPVEKIRTRRQDKKAHFADGSFTEERGLQRTTSAPQATRQQSSSSSMNFLRGRIERDLSSQFRPDCVEEGRSDTELASTIGAFEAMLEELAQVAEEHAEAHDELIAVAKKVVELVLDQSSEDSGSDAGMTCSSDRVAIHDSSEDSNAKTVLRASHRSFTDEEDVDESRLPHNSNLDELDLDVWRDVQDEDEMPTSQPEEVFMTDESNIHKLDLGAFGKKSNTSTDTVWAQSSRTSDPRGVSGADQAAVIEANQITRRASMSDLVRPDGKPRLLPHSMKARPADCAVTVCSVRTHEPAKLIPIYEHPRARFRQMSAPSTCVTTAQTVRSDSGTFQIVWEDLPSSSRSSIVTSLDSPAEPGITTPEDVSHFPGPPSPMEKVKTKLAVWSWAREQGMNLAEEQRTATSSGTYEHMQQSPPIRTPRSEDPQAPPNTKRASDALSANRSRPPSGGRSPSPLQSKPASPLIDPGVVEEAEEDADDRPLELKAKAILPRHPHKPGPFDDYLTVPVSKSKGTPPSPTEPVAGLPRQYSNLAAEETHFNGHRNSVDLLQHRQQHNAKFNQGLMHAADSMILAKSKYDDKFPKSFLDVPPVWRRADALTPVQDTSPIVSEVCGVLEAEGDSVPRQRKGGDRQI